MSAAVQISRDTEGIRFELLDRTDIKTLQELGPYSMRIEGDEIFFTPTAEGNFACTFPGSSGKPGLRFHDFNKGHGQGVKSGRFGPVEVEADIYNPDGFSVDLPQLHKRPWPRLRDNDGYYDVGEQMILTIAERINDLIDFCGMPINDAIRNQSRKIPPDLRRFLPRGAEFLVRSKMGKLRLLSTAS